MYRAVLMALLTVCSTLHAAPKAAPSLDRAEFFAVGPISDDAQTSVGERSLRTLLAQHEPAAALRRLIDSASPAGQLYALLGLRLSDEVAFRQVLPTFTSRQDRVETMVGCLGLSEQVRTVAEKIAHGDYDEILRRPPR